MNIQPKNTHARHHTQAALEHLVATYGWEDMARRIRINCFAKDPSINSSLTFYVAHHGHARRWERLYLATMKRTNKKPR